MPCPQPGGRAAGRLAPGRAACSEVGPRRTCGAGLESVPAVRVKPAEEPPDASASAGEKDAAVVRPGDEAGSGAAAVGGEADSAASVCSAGESISAQE